MSGTLGRGLYSLHGGQHLVDDGDPLVHLEYEPVLAKIKTALTERYFEGMIESLLLDNTHRAVIAEEDEAPVGVGSEVIAIINEECFFELDAAPVRVHSALVPQPYNHTLEKATIPDHEDVVKAVLKMFGKA